MLILASAGRQTGDQVWYYQKCRSFHHFILVFGREKVLGLSPEAISSLGSAGRFIYEYVGDSPIVSSFKDRLRAEVLSSKVRLSAEIRTAISHTSRLFASHSSAGIRGA